jgi:hypothetical protein
MPVGPGLAEPERTEELRARLDNREPTRGSHQGQRASGSAGRIHSSSRPRMPERRRNLLAAREASIHPVLDLAAGAVDVLVEGPGGDRAGRQGGHDEARVAPLGQMLGLGDDPALPAPAVQRLAAGLGNGAPTPFRRPSRRSRRSGAPARPGPGSRPRPRRARRRWRRPGAGCARGRRRSRCRAPRTRPSTRPGQSPNRRAARSSPAASGRGSGR